MWSFAYCYRKWISNCLPNTRTKPLTPLKIWSSVDPIPQQLYPCGVKAVVHIPKDTRKKLDNQAWIGLLVGYQEDGRSWIFWNQQCNQFIALECATFLDPNDPLLSQHHQPHVCAAWHLGWVPTEEICKTQDCMIEDIGYSPDIAILANLKQAQKSLLSTKW